MADDAEEDAGAVAVAVAGGDGDDGEAVAVVADRTVQDADRHDEWSPFGSVVWKRWSRPGRRKLGG
jgi:hypothetical protein